VPYTYEYPRPAVTVDALVATRGAPREVLLVRRKHPPFAGLWAIPGGFVEEEEDLEPAVLRELEEETGLRGVRLHQFRTYGTPGRDPRGRTISVVYVALLPEASAPPRVSGGDDAAEARFFRADRLPDLAFDHARIIEEALAWLDARLRTGEIGS
jgi:8-oxo-dGTP diphosphatase